MIIGHALSASEATFERVALSKLLTALPDASRSNLVKLLAGSNGPFYQNVSAAV